MQTFFNVEKIISRLKELFNCSTNEELAMLLGVSKGTIGSWKSRNTIDLKLVVAKCNHANYNWIINGEGEMLKNTTNNINQKVKGDNNIITGQNKGHIQSTINNKDDIISNLQQHLINYKNIIDEKDQQINKLLEVINKITK